MRRKRIHQCAHLASLLHFPSLSHLSASAPRAKTNLGRRPVGKVRENQRVDLFLVLAEDDEMSELLPSGKRAYLLHRERPSLVIEHARENTDELSHELKELLGRPRPRGHHNLRIAIPCEDGGKLVFRLVGLNLFVASARVGIRLVEGGKWARAIEKKEMGRGVV